MERGKVRVGDRTSQGKGIFKRGVVGGPRDLEQGRGKGEDGLRKKGEKRRGKAPRVTPEKARVSCFHGTGSHKGGV